MQLRFFTIPIHSDENAAEELNHFLGTHRILGVDRSFVQDGVNSAWTFCVSFESVGERPQFAKRPKIDYREVLNEQDFAVFAKLRNLRKELAEKENVPAFTIMNNEQLAEMVRRRVQTAAAMGEIPAVGEARIEKYGEPFLRLLREAFSASVDNPQASSRET